ncbi:hypothetical protein [Legionella impletisoli]|uniref:Uncharacterized protein n=1 Tax=Legionella impletisoli TaxID=343510 RepID=A0A917NBI3_9GAMM|nr:hypothetical protein [Legionella impletisoli]GGI84593.1 hypothetical protein GCM10007966_11460 [Legionella impletisoli]
MVNIERLKTWLHDIAEVIEQSQNLDPRHYSHFIQEPELAIGLIDLIVAMEELDIDVAKPYYSACVFALEICISQLQAATESQNKLAARLLDQLMSHLADSIQTSGHSLSFWLPILNAFYEVHVELSDELKEAYYSLASEEELTLPQEEDAHLNSIRDLIEELSDLSTFDIAENFFAQSYALPAEFFTDLVIDLYSIEEGQDIALLTLLHPKAEVRDVVIGTIDLLMDKITLNSVSLSRLQAIKHWYPISYQAQFDRWIKIQRKRGVVFQNEKKNPTLRIKASEVDGSGAQGIFIHFKQRKINRLCGLLFKLDIGIKDAWFTPDIPTDELNRYYDESFEETVMLRDVDIDYLTCLTNHFLAISIAHGEMPDLHLLEIQEELGLQFIPQHIDEKALLQQLTIQIAPFTHVRVDEALQRSRGWSKTKRFTESWYIENQDVDKVVNQFCSFMQGTKVCDFEAAMDAVFAQVFEKQRDRWLFHFIWVALWLKNKARKSEKTWEDCVLIAHLIAQNKPLCELPIMQEICEQTVHNSIETMTERRTYLT